VPHGGIERVRPADAIDPAYGRLLREAQDKGVELLAWGATPTPEELVLNRRLEIVL
jgi:sugar fermentation stimulation protein A